MFIESKATVCKAICDALRTTSALGSGNALREIRYVKRDDGEEYAIPIFENGNGEPNEYWENGYYAVRITGDSGLGIWKDVTERFVNKI